MPTTDDNPFPFCDVALSRRLEGAEARNSAGFIEARRRVAPEHGACWTEVAGAYALFDGVGSPVTQTFGLGVFQKPTAADLDAIEKFFQERGADVDHEVSPLADPSLLLLLSERGYRPLELTSILFRPVRCGERLTAAADTKVRVRVIESREHEIWTQTSARGWATEYPDLADQFRDFQSVAASHVGGVAFLAELDGRPVAAAMMNIAEGVAHLAGASTVPEARRQGAQLALLDARLRTAAEAGCDLVTMGALPGSASQRNAERHGFRIAYTRIKWRLARK
jgi:hypothetical protein